MGPLRRIPEGVSPQPVPRRPAQILEPTYDDLVFALTMLGREHGVHFNVVDLPPPVGHEVHSDPSDVVGFPPKVNRLAQQLRAKLSPDERGHFDLFLQNFLGMKDCENERGRRNAIAKLEQLLEGACQNTQFRKTMVSLMPQACASCGDRFSYYFGEMETHWHVACDPKAKTPEGLAKLLIGLRRKKLLDEHAEALARRLGNEEEEIETITALRAALAEEFELPVSIREIRHTGCTRLEQRDIQEARNLLLSTKDLQVMTEILIENENWRNLIKPQVDRAFETVSKESEEVFGQVDDVEYDKDQEKEDVMKDIQRLRDLESRRILKKVTLRFLDSIYRRRE